MPPIFKTYKSLIDTFLLQFLDAKKSALGEVNDLGPDLLERIKKMVVAGKTIRGSLVLLAYCFTNKKPSDDAIKLAAAMELMQTALLVHDDIMDRDEMRRGIPSFHKQYESDALAMCAGDVLFFLAFELLGSLHTDALTHGRIIRFVGREYQLVGVAQMADVKKIAKTKLEVLSLYTNKTARYTFAVPLMLGAILTGTTKDTLKYLESYGVAAGVLFQIRDDKLDNEKNLFSAQDIDAYTVSAHESIARLTTSGHQKKILEELLMFVSARNI